VTSVPERRLDRIDRFAAALDSAVRLPVVGRVGLDPVLGLVPVGGDLLAAALSSLVVVEAWRLGAPRRVLLRMCLSVAVDAALGSVPVLGDLFDARRRANERNAALVRRWAARADR
jgi:hypothetical protein